MCSQQQWTWSIYCNVISLALASCFGISAGTSYEMCFTKFAAEWIVLLSVEGIVLLLDSNLSTDRRLEVAHVIENYPTGRQHAI